MQKQSGGKKAAKKVGKNAMNSFWRLSKKDIVWNNCEASLRSANLNRNTSDVINRMELGRCSGYFHIYFTAVESDLNMLFFNRCTVMQIQKIFVTA
jgi:hypothetical protein